MRTRPSPLANPVVSATLGVASGIVMAVSVFLPWYRTNLGEITAPGSASGWEWTALAKGALLLAVVWTVAAGVVAADRMDMLRIDPRTAEGLGWIATLCALGAGGLVAFRIFRPPPEQAEFLTRDFGLFVGIAAAVVGTAAGFAMATYRESVRRRYVER